MFLKPPGGRISIHPPLLYGSPTPRRVFSGVRGVGGGCVKFGPPIQVWRCLCEISTGVLDSEIGNSQPQMAMNRCIPLESNKESQIDPCIAIP